MDFTPLLKKCNLCKFDTCLIYKNNNDVSCPICITPNTNNLKSVITNENYRDKNYHYCQTCNILFYYDETAVHHVLDNYGKIYYASLIKRCKIEGRELNYMPTFYSMDMCIKMLNENVIEMEWINFVKNDMCCVCLDETNTFTECNHALCKTCRDQLISVKCPICRHDQQYKNFNTFFNCDDDLNDY